MSSATYVDATDLTEWAGRRDAQGDLPRLVSRLVLVTGGDIKSIAFRAGAGVQLGGWDGLVVTERGNAFVPAGVSGWELSTSNTPGPKATDDYMKRTEDPKGLDPSQTVFVAVSLRVWPSKQEWVQDRLSERVWREVRAYDAHDLEMWLESAPAVHLWLSLKLGKHPEGACDVNEYWRGWSGVTRPSIPAGFILAGRAGASSRIGEWLRSGDSVLGLRAESRDEALAVLAGTVESLPEDARESVHARCVVVDDEHAWDRLRAAKEPLLLVPRPDYDIRPEALALARSAGHRVVLPLGRTDGGSESLLEIPKLDVTEAAKALEQAGEPEARASELAALARRSLTAFRRKLAADPALQQPEWAGPANGPSLVTVLLAGAWSDSNPDDRQAVAGLASVSYDQLKPQLVRWCEGDDPLVRGVGDAWHVVSKEDAWVLLSRYLKADALDRLRTVVVELLGTPDPAYDLPDDERWLAPIKGKKPKGSDLLRKGLADTMAMLGSRGGRVNVTTGVTAADVAGVIVRDVLARANSDWRVWASLSYSLALLAEAAPDEFLSAVDAGLAGAEPVLLKLFAPKDVGPMGPTSPHPGLLWALETLAWSPVYLGRAALCLARLARLDPGGKLGNRPSHSLHSIFLPWLPQTAADLGQRLVVIDMLRSREPAVAWQLLRDLLPQHNGFGEYTPTPRWRDWAPDAVRRRTQAEYLHAIRDITGRMLEDADVDGHRWADLVATLGRLPPEQHRSVVAGLESLDPEQLGDEGCAAVWNALRDLLSMHRTVPDAEWALPVENVERLAAVYGRFEPRDLSLRYAWLFDSAPSLPDGKSDRNEYWAILKERQTSAVVAVFQTHGLAGLLTIAGKAARPDVLGSILAQSGAALSLEDSILHDNLASGVPYLADFARGYATARAFGEGLAWVRGKLFGAAQDWPVAQRGRLLAALPGDRSTWQLASEAGTETEHAYWLLTPWFGIQDDDEEQAAQEFFDHGRLYESFEVLAGRAMLHKQVSPQLVVEVLKAIAAAPTTERLPESFAYKLAHLFGVLEASNAVAETTLAQLEWQYLPVTTHRWRRPALLLRELNREPGFFVDLVCWLYKAENEEPHTPTEEEQARAHHARELLECWRSVPGTSESGEIDHRALQEWVHQARTGLSEKGRRRGGDLQLGQALSGSPPGQDGAWPHPAVRDVIESNASDDLERGISMAVYNSRGFMARDPAQGGRPERELATQYEGYAAIVSARWPRTSALLRRMAAEYKRDALREDQETELEDGLR